MTWFICSSVYTGELSAADELDELNARTWMWPCCLSLANFFCRMLLEKLLDLGFTAGRRRKVSSSVWSFEVLGHDKGGSKSGIVALEGLDKLSGAPFRGC